MNPEPGAVRVAPPTFAAWRPPWPERAAAVLLSGGLDSAVAALRLREAGWDVCGFTMRVPLLSGAGGEVPVEGAAEVCARLGVPHYYLELGGEFARLVVEPFRTAYAAGKTPSPCVVCNRTVKFGLCLNMIEAAFGVRNFATGHYARIVNYEGKNRLARGADAGRDQSYFLYGIPTGRLAGLHFPLGELGREEAQRLAAAAGLGFADRESSMELCFAGGDDYRAALGGGGRPGVIRDVSGRELGRHDGVENFTVGQRRGLGVAAAQPLYVLSLDASKNEVVVGPREAALTRRVRAAGLNAHAPERLRPGARFFGRIRSAGEPAACAVTETGDDLLAVEFDEPVFGPARGQHLVLYDERQAVVAGGEIC